MAKVERDQQCQSVIKQRMAEGLIPKARLCDDVALFKGQEDPDALGVIGGFSLPSHGLTFQLAVFIFRSCLE